MAKGTRKNGRGTAKKGGSFSEWITWAKGKMGMSTGQPSSLAPSSLAPSSAQTSSARQPDPNGDYQSAYQSPNTLYPIRGGKKRKPTLKGGDGVTGHTQSGVATGAYKIGGRTRKQRKSRKSRRH
jgi:hypothetical protein